MSPPRRVVRVPLASTTVVPAELTIASLSPLDELARSGAISSRLAVTRIKPMPSGWTA